MHAFSKCPRLATAVKFVKGCIAIAVRLMVDSKTQMVNRLEALLLIREFFAHARAYAEQTTKTGDLNLLRCVQDINQ